MWSERSTVLTVVQSPLCSGINGSLRHRNSNIMFSSCLMRGCIPAQDRNLDEGFKGRKTPQKSGMSSETTGTPSVASKTSKFQHLSCGNMWKTSQKRTGIRTNKSIKFLPLVWNDAELPNVRPKRLYRPLVAAFRATHPWAALCWRPFVFAF